MCVHLYQLKNGQARDGICISVCIKYHPTMHYGAVCDMHLYLEQLLSS